MIKREYIELIYTRYKHRQMPKSMIKAFEIDIEQYKHYRYGPHIWKEIVDSFKLYLTK